MDYEIKITGQGKKREIIKALKELAESISDADLFDTETGKKEFEDPILMTVITQVDED